MRGLHSSLHTPRSDGIPHQYSVVQSDTRALCMVASNSPVMLVASLLKTSSAPYRTMLSRSSLFTCTASGGSSNQWADSASSSAYKKAPSRWRKCSVGLCPPPPAPCKTWLLPCQFSQHVVLKLVQAEPAHGYTILQARLESLEGS